MKFYGTGTVIALVGFVVAYQYIEPAPPDHIVIATGRQDGAYYRFAERYQAILARQGIALEIRSTSGSVENLRLLADPASGVEVAFAQSGITAPPTAAPPLLALASLYFEPLWIFCRNGIDTSNINDLRGKRIAIGEEGSGARAIALQLLADHGVAGQPTQLLPLNGAAATQALLAGELDAVFTVAAFQAERVQTLLHSTDITLLSYQQAPAYMRLHRYLSAVTLPMGVVDLAHNQPPHDITLLAPAATLVTHEDLHPALIDLLLQTATEVHGAGGMFEDPLQFPSPRFVGFALHDEAQRFYHDGPSILQRFLPFWAATFVDRTKVMILPLLALLLPLFKLVPPTYQWRIRSRVYRWYSEVQAVDEAFAKNRARERLSEYLAELERIEGEARRVVVPLAYADALYTLRLHIDLIRNQILRAER
ncbi:MAG: TAXI family TRAP transporter solute-binding subunit [Gammaproteobacteria bacterium]